MPSVGPKGPSVSTVLVDMLHPRVPGLHLGQARTFCLADAVARFRRLAGAEVLFPVGWDVYGIFPERLHRLGMDVNETITKNIAGMSRDLKLLDISIDWDHEVRTDEIGFAHLTQRIGLWLLSDPTGSVSVRREESRIETCPTCGKLSRAEHCKGTCVYCGAPVAETPNTAWLVEPTLECAQEIGIRLSRIRGIPIRRQSELAARLQALSWNISRQRGFGVRLPIVCCSSCGCNPIQESDLDDFGTVDRVGVATATCRICGRPAIPSHDTLTNWICSSWYWMYLLSDGFELEGLTRCRPIDVSVGSAAQLGRHLVYAHIVAAIVHARGLIAQADVFKQRLSLGPLVEPTGASYSMDTYGEGSSSSAACEAYGVDATRLALLSAPVTSQPVRLDGGSFLGAQRFLRRLEAYADEVQDTEIWNSSPNSMLSHDTLIGSARPRILAAYMTGRIDKVVAESGSILRAIKRDKPSAVALRELLAWVEPLVPTHAKALHDRTFGTPAGSQTVWNQILKESNEGFVS